MGLHQRYQRILQGQPVPTLLAGRKEVEEEVSKRLGDAFQRLMHALFKEKGAALRIDILQEPEVQEFIDTHADVLDGAMQQVPLSDTMRQRLTRSNYVFSGMKTFHELNEAFPSLLDENGNRKPFERFFADVRNIDETYNRHYLRAEYGFVQASASMAAKWESFQQDGGRYYLQYRTQQDEKVRPEHAALHGVTLPMNDSFWNEYYPPNGWNCRCTVVQVRKSKYPATPHDEAMALGEEATGKDAKGMFHFNAGKEQKSVPDYNPYTISRCKNCDVAKGKISLSKPLNCEQCQWCQILHIGGEKMTFREDEKFGKRLLIGNHADMTELEDNLRAAKAILSSFPEVSMRIRQHILVQNMKNPEYDVIHEGVKLVGDRKGIKSPKGVADGFAKAKKQGCQCVIIDLDKEMSDKHFRMWDVARHIKNDCVTLGLRRAGGVGELRIIAFG